MRVCKFCEQLADWDQANDEQWQRDKEQGKERSYNEYAVALVIRTYRKGAKKKGSRIVDYWNKGRGYKLNYCPECGVKL